MSQRLIGLITVWSEANTLLKYAQVDTVTTHSQARLHRGHLAGRPVAVAAVGPGKVHTAAITQHLIDHYNVGLMVSCGSAGALAPHLQVGDVILVDTVTLHDAGLYVNGNFQYLGIYDNSQPGRLRYHRALLADPALLAVARQTALNMTWPHQPPAIETGGLVSGDQVIADDVKKQWLRDTFNALAVEMETGAMAHVAFLNNIPWLAVRAISDSADASLNIDPKHLITYSDDPQPLLTQLRQTITVAQKPSRLITALKIRRGIRTAATHAARVTADIITQIA